MENLFNPVQNQHSIPDMPLNQCRRAFLNKIGTIGAAFVATGAAIPKSPTAQTSQFDGYNHENQKAVRRANEACRIRLQAAKQQRNIPLPPHPDNGDEKLYFNRIGNFSKGLPHNSIGEVNPYAYNVLLYALSSGKPSDFENIPLGSPPDTRSKLVNPQAALAFDLQGTDSHAHSVPPPPKLNSKETAGEMVENCWMALCRDIPFSQYNSHPLTVNAASEISDLSHFHGPKTFGRVTPQTLFRVEIPGALNGPYISQFLWKVPPFGATYIEPKILTALPDINYATSFQEWLSLQNGIPPFQSNHFDSQRRYIRNGRDLSTWVHIDKLFQSYFNALLIMLAQPSSDPFVGGIAAPFNPGNPYLHSVNQTGFGTFGAENVLSLLGEVSNRALKGQWFQKWLVHRRLRPEEYGGLVHLKKKYHIPYPLDEEILNSFVLNQIYSQFGSYLLPLSYPEGCPLHPSYGAGHATVAGACVTVLKAWFQEDYIIPDPVVTTDDGLNLIPYSGQPLTLSGELNKLATNIAIGRDHAGVHWRSDALASLILGETIAISVMKDQKMTYNETFHGFSFTKFDGTRITI